MKRNWMSWAIPLAVVIAALVIFVLLDVGGDGNFVYDFE